jgi:hypothetical protein
VRHALILALLAACAQPAEDAPPIASHVESFDWPGSPPGRFDVLFVIDDTADMIPYLDRTQDMLRALDGLLPAMPWAPRQPSWHIAVTTADPADAGVLRRTPLLAEPYLIDEATADGERLVNYTGTMADALAMLGAVGTSGHGATPLANARAAIEGTPSFVRSSAYLVIVIVSAHDDASAAPVADLVAWAKGVKTNPDDVVSIVVAPASAPRLDAFVAQLPNRETHTVIDDADYTHELSILGQLYQTSLAAPCIDEPLDVDAETPGGQYDCEVEIVHDDGVVQVVPACPGAVCWQYVPDPQNCGAGTGGHITIPPYRWGYHYPETLRGQCVVGN